MPTRLPTTPVRPTLFAIPVALALFWSYWPTLEVLAGRWMHDPRYAHGPLVPLFALALWAARSRGAGAPAGRPSWWGAAAIVAGGILRLAGARFAVDWLDAVSLLPVLAGLALLSGGWAALRRCAVPIGFLLFMIPLPYRLEVALSGPLQRAAAEAGAYALRTLGTAAVADGTLIELAGSGTTLEVGAACSGLSMLVLFFALSTGVAIGSRRRWADRALIVLSAAPIALFANVARIALTGLVHEAAGKRIGDALAHDLAGWLMIPLALGVLALELRVLSLLFVERPPAPVGPIPLVGTAAPVPRPQEAGLG